VLLVVNVLRIERRVIKKNLQALGAGFLPILFDDRRRGLQDMLARTVVISADQPARRRDATAPAEGAA
jgi:uncharacterized RDD family membrane protein YckC